MCAHAYAFVTGSIRHGSRASGGYVYSVFQSIAQIRICTGADAHSILLKIPYAVPLTMGLLGGPACVVPVACGTVFII